MATRSRFRDPLFWTCIGCFVVTVHLVTAIGLRRINVNVLVGSIEFPHLLSYLGTGFITLYTPFYYVMKRRYRHRLRPLLTIHIVGNLVSLLMIGIHIANRLIRVPFGVGFALFFAVLLLSISGFIYRFGLLVPLGISKNVPHYNRVFHVSLTTSFFLIVVFHLVNAFVLNELWG